MKRLTEEQRAELIRRLAARESFDVLAKAFGIPRIEISKFAMWALYVGELKLS
jgi:hypothetical protein